ncbi:MAG TPA: SLC13 family permease [Candidatus Angelobacter sp.]|nr:SLC13 family permease [Candidatus Angelobacter sp.]
MICSFRATRSNTPVHHNNSYLQPSWSSRPPVYAAIKKARTEALPYLLSCAFIANAASFLLPISNPANLFVYGKQLPPLLPWLKIFLLPSLVSIAVTFLVLRLIARQDLRGKAEDGSELTTLTPEGRRAVWGMALAAVVLISASLLGVNLGLPTFAAAVIAIAVAAPVNRKAVIAIVGSVSWSVLPMVAGLFILVEALNAAGALRDIGAAMRMCTQLSPLTGSLSASFGVALLSNVMNNLASGMLTGSAMQTGAFPNYIQHALLIGADLGPNLSVTGSLATILWLIAVRREGGHVSTWTLFKAGAL